MSERRYLAVKESALTVLERDTEQLSAEAVDAENVMTSIICPSATRTEEKMRILAVLCCAVG